VTLHNASSDVRGAAVRLLVVVSVTDPPSPKPVREYTFGVHDAPSWAEPGTDRVVDLTGDRAAVNPGEAVQAAGSALALTVHAAATALPSDGCPVPFRLGS
jgi:hypothetical protein